MIEANNAIVFTLRDAVAFLSRCDVPHVEAKFRGYLADLESAENSDALHAAYQKLLVASGAHGLLGDFANGRDSSYTQVQFGRQVSFFVETLQEQLEFELQRARPNKSQQKDG